jgi:DNA modification methylase
MKRIDYQIINGDALEEMKNLPSSSFDLVITSPPYNLGNTSGGGMKQYKGHYNSAGGMKARGGNSKWKGAELANGYDGFDDNLSHQAYIDWQKSVLLECWRLIKPSGAIYYNHKKRILNGVCITPLAYNPDLPVRDIITWVRSGGINFNTCFYLPVSEWIVVFAKPAFRLKSKGASAETDVWRFTQEMNNPHPAPFPMELPKRILDSTTGKKVLDPFSGSGTTGAACALAGRDFTGIELSEKWCRYTEARIERALGNPVEMPQMQTRDKPLPLFEQSF